MGTFEWIIVGATVWMGWLGYCFLAGKQRETDEEYAARVAAERHFRDFFA
jgi:hypothetical protein